MVADPAVDVVYVASPHSMHAEHVRLSFEAGKPVLCEKPLTPDAASTEELLAEAQERGLFLMEAMWMACHPLVRAVVARVRSGELGRLRQVRAGLGFVVDAGPDDRMFDPTLGASAVLDMGIYPLTLAYLLLGNPSEVTAVADVDDRGVDLDAVVGLRWDGGEVAALTCSMTSYAPRDALLSTDRGQVHLAAPFHHPDHAVFTDLGSTGPDAPAPDEGTLDIIAEDDVVGRGYGTEALEAMRCLREGLLESPLVPHRQSVDLARVMDQVLAQVGARGPR